MALVEFTPRAEKSLLEILGEAKPLDEALLVVEMHDREAQLTVKSAADLKQLQRDLDMVGPFRVPIGDAEVSLFVHDSGPARSGPYELDCNACGGPSCFQIRRLPRG